MFQLFFQALLVSFNEFLSGGDASTTFTIVNKCAYTIWPVFSSSTENTPIPITGFVLQEGDSHDIQAPSSWKGQLWARSHCFANSTGKFTCLTGDCGSGKIECDGAAYPATSFPATLVEFALNVNGYNGIDFYDVSLVNGYNLPLLVAPQVQSGTNCTTAGCVADINAMCPSALRVTAEGGDDIACKSACNEFNKDQYCCTGAYNSQSTCKPTNYSGVFKKWCPNAYSYFYDDDRTSTFTCSDTNYTITFCPLPSASRKSSPESDGNTIPTTNSTMVYDGVKGFSTTGAASTCIHILRPPPVAGALAIAIALWRLCHMH